MDFDKIVNEATLVAINAIPSVEEDMSTSTPPVPPSLQNLVDNSKPIIRYVNALVAESLRLYHDELHSQDKPSDMQ